MYSDGKNIIITKEVAKTAAAASHRAMETWQKAAGIIPICVRLAITVCGGDRYQDTGEGARSMVGPLSFTLPHPGPGLATTQSRSQPDPILTHLVSFRVSPSLHATKGKVERVMPGIMSKGMCEKVSVCSHGITVLQLVTMANTD